LEGKFGFPVESSGQTVQKTLLEELLESTPETDHLDPQLIFLTVLAGIVALIGLFVNNVAIIIGAMVISPMLAPIYACTIFLANGKFIRSLKNLGVLIGLLVLLIVTSAAITWLLLFFVELSVTPEILARTGRNEIYIVLAIVLGITAIVAHKRGFIESVTGIGIAAALAPPAVVTGISLVLYPLGMIRALLLTFDNIFGLLTGMFIAILVLGVGPRHESRKKLARKGVYITVMMLAVVIVLLYLSIRFGNLA